MICITLQVRQADCCLQSVANNRLDVPGSWFSQQLHFGTIVADWLMHLWPDGKLATLHIQLHLHETQLAAGVMLLAQMTGLGQQQTGQLPASLAQRELSSFIVSTLWGGLQDAAQQAHLQMPQAQKLQQAAQHIHSCNLTATAKRFILLASCKLLSGVSSKSLPQMHDALQALLQCDNQQASASTVYIDLLQLLPTLDMPQAAARAVECLFLDLTKRIGKAQDIQLNLKSELDAALRVIFLSALPISKHMQEYLLIDLLSPQTLQPANRAKRSGIRAAIQHFADEHFANEQMPMRPVVLLRVQEAELTYLPSVYRDIRYLSTMLASCV